MKIGKIVLHLASRNETNFRNVANVMQIAFRNPPYNENHRKLHKSDRTFDDVRGPRLNFE